METAVVFFVFLVFILKDSPERPVLLFQVKRSAGSPEALLVYGAIWCQTIHSDGSV